MALAQSKPVNEAHANNPIRIVVAYEDCDAGKRAHQACQQILELAHLSKDLSADLWKFDMLQLRALRETAAEDAAGADLLVLAPQDGSELPGTVLEWIQLSLMQPRHPKALLVLLAQDPDNYDWVPQATCQLKMLAAKRGVPFWCLQLESPNGAWSEPIYRPGDLDRIAQQVFPPRQAISVSTQPGRISSRKGA